MATRTANFASLQGVMKMLLAGVLIALCFAAQAGGVKGMIRGDDGAALALRRDGICRGRPAHALLPGAQAGVDRAAATFPGRLRGGAIRAS